MRASEAVKAPPAVVLTCVLVLHAGLAIVRQRDAALGSEGAKENPADPAYVQALIDLHEECKQVRAYLPLRYVVELDCPIPTAGHD